MRCFVDGEPTEKMKEIRYDDLELIREGNNLSNISESKIRTLLRLAYETGWDRAVIECGE